MEERIFFLTGQIVTDDGSPIPRDLIVERVCNGRVTQQVHATPRGDFTMQMGSMFDNFMDASAGSGKDPNSQFGLNSRNQQNNNAQMGISRRELFSCDLRASVSGFRSAAVSLFEFQPTSGSINVGSILVQRGEKMEGVTVSATLYTAPKDARKAYEKGLEAEKNNKFEDARKYFERAVETYPQHANAWFHLGTMLQKDSQNDAALNAYTKATTADSKFLPPYLALTSLAGAAENWTEVLSLTNHILEGDPLNYPSAYFYSSFANYKLKKFDDAEKTALRAVRLDVQNRIPQLHLLLAEIYSHKSDYANAVSEMQTYLKVAPNAKNADQVKEQIARYEKLQAPPLNAQPSATETPN
jgi:tetratricopeptide (TPR) repeat protein